MTCRFHSHHTGKRRGFAIGAILLLAVSGAAGAVLPIAFEPNRGQGSGDYLAHANGFALSLASNRIGLTGRRAHIVATLTGARQDVRPQPEEALPGVVHYLKGNDRSRWITDVPTFRRVRYHGIYPGIDAVYYGKEGRLEYDFVIAPGSDPRRIRLHYDGAAGMQIDAAGDLVLGSFRQHRPIVYQQIEGVRREVSARYALKGNTVRFELGAYDRTRELVIDPVITWATYFGSGAGESGEAVALDPNGNIYIAGTTFDSSGYGDAFFAKLTPDGTTAQVTTVFGGSYDTECHAIAVDAAGNFYLAGETNSPDFPADPSLTVSAGYNGDAFISKVAPTGKSLIYSYFLGGSGQEIAFGIALDSATNAYVVGATVSPDFPVSSGTAQPVAAGGVDAFVIKFDASGNGVYSTFLGGAGDDYGYSIAADNSGNVFVSGSTTSTAFPVTSGALQTHTAGGVDAFVTKLSPTGTLVYSTYLGGSGDDNAYGIAIDANGVAYVTGETKSTDFPTVNPAQAASGGNGDLFAVKLNGDGASLAYSTYLGGGGEDSGSGIAVDKSGAAYLVGTTGSTDFPLTDAFQSANAAVSNALVAALDPSGAVLFSSYLGGSGSGSGSSAAGDYGAGAAVNCAAGLVALGSTTSSNFPVTSGVYQTTYQGGTDAFVARIGVGGNPAITGVVSTASLTAGPLAPGSLISVLGSSLAGATVTVNGSNVTTISTTTGRVDLQLPNEVGVGSATLSVGNGCGTSSPATLQVAQAAPYVRQAATGDAVASNQDGSANSAANPAKTGSVIVVSLTGIGPVDNPVATGTAAPMSPLSRATLPNSATVGGWDSTVQFLGLTPGTIGWAQANLVVPGLSPGAYPVVITIGGVASNGPTVYVQ